MCYNVKRMCIKSSPLRGGSGWGFLEDDTYKRRTQGLLECWLDTAPDGAVGYGHGDATSAEVQGPRHVPVPCDST